MLTEPLPTHLDVRKAVTRGLNVTGSLKTTDLPRFLPLLAGAEGKIWVEMRFSRDEERRSLLHLAIDADIIVSCQRCLDAMPLHITSNSTLALVWSDEEASHLPKFLEPLIVKESTCDLRHVVEDELILSLPAFNYHKLDDCNLKTADYSDPDPDHGLGKEKSNPFNVLEHLKSGK